MCVLCVLLTVGCVSEAEPGKTDEQGGPWNGGEATESSLSAYPRVASFVPQTVALLPIDAFDLDPHGAMRTTIIASETHAILRGNTEHPALCEQNRQGFVQPTQFSNQPTNATCSGILLDSQTVLTATHCLTYFITASPDGNRRVEDVVFAVGYTSEAWSRHGTAMLPMSSMRMNGTLVERTGDDDAAIVRLDEAFAIPVQRLSFRRSEPTTMRGVPMVMVGHPVGVPRKYNLGIGADRLEGIDDSHRYASRLFSTLDAFGGFSGSPVWTTGGTLLGILTDGRGDLIPNVTAQGCYEYDSVTDGATGLVSVLDELTTLPNYVDVL